jgi:hypothetical protein
MATLPDYPILGPARITSAGFASVLTSNRSPAAGEAAACYAAFVNAGVDPAVGLALFRKESTFGKYGRALPNRSWGNIRGGLGYPLDSGNFRRYPTWTLGAQDAARLLGVYGRNQIRPGRVTSTVQSFPYVWAPSADGNAPDAYGDSLATWIGQWQRAYLPGGPGSYNPPPFTPPAGSQAKTVSTGTPAGRTTTLAAYAGIPPDRRDNLNDVIRELVIINGAPDRPPYGGKFAREQLALGHSGADLVQRADTFLAYVTQAAGLGLNVLGIPSAPGPFGMTVTAGDIRLPITGSGAIDVDAMAGKLAAGGGFDPFGVGGIAAAIGAVPAALANVLTNGLMLAMILVMIILGLYLVVTSQPTAASVRHAFGG